MKTPVGAGNLPANPQALPAANEEFKGSSASHEKTAGTRSGWDPYEVWLTRIKPVQDKSDPGLTTF